MLYLSVIGTLLVTTVSGRPETGDLKDRETILQTAAIARPGTRSESDETDDSWSKLQISPQAIASMPYLNFRISIYKDSGKLQASEEKPKYFYAPLSFLDTQSADSRKNNVTKEFEMSFRVYLWSEKIETEIAKYLSKYLKTEVATEQVQVIPFERVILASTSTTDSYHISSEWIPYQFHQYLWFRFTCNERETCDNLAEQMRSDSEQFSHLRLRFSLESQQSRRKETTIKVENIQSGALFSELNQRFPESDEVLLTAADAKRLVSESASNVILETFSDEEILAPQDQSPIYSLLEKFMIAGREAISSDSSERWNSVFWNEDNYRPDKTTKTFNEVYRNSVKEAQDKLKEVISSSQKTSTEIGLAFEDFGFKTGFTRETSNSNEKEKEKFLKTIAEAKDTVQWEGEKFAPKPMALSRVNLSKTRNNQTFHDLSTTVKYSKAVLSTAVNTPSSTIQSEVLVIWKGIKAKLENTRAELENLQTTQEGQVAALRTEVDSFTRSVNSLIDRSSNLLKKLDNPIYFSAYRTSKYPDLNTIITYDGIWVNVGGAMNSKTGTFTAPYHGIYFFSFHGHFSASLGWNSLILKVDGKARAAAGHNDNTKYMGITAEYTCGPWSPAGATAGLSVTLELTRGSQVNVMNGASSLADLTFSGYEGPYYGTHFNGLLLYNLE